ncbi:cytochrome P450 2J2-like isoform X6 [Suncus etruscus]|uniref:cytochrome P450 2J2-like isoform X6 n=1 Tax=Suncus etruscus TaxID=109475 RepID=UPI00210F9205|nr:cytochrome P450 2J2-like isoform X6 [Suncus etruscus]
MGFLETVLWSVLHARTLLLGAVAFLFFAYVFRKPGPKNMPPGPPRLPILGNLFQLGFKEPHLQIQQVVKKYGNVICMKFGGMYTIFITGLPLIKEALVHQDQHFINRPVLPMQNRIFKGKGQPFDPQFKINNAVSNIICSVTFGERFEYQDEKFQGLLRMLDEAMSLLNSPWCQLYNVFPRIMKSLPGPHQTFFNDWEKLTLFVAKIIENHKRDWNPNETRDFIDAYLKEMEKHKDDTATSIDEENLIYTTLDLFLAGTETTSTTLLWALLYMALYSDIQEKVHAEIDRVIGQMQQPTMALRESMPYTLAVVHEVLRKGNIVPLNAPREVTADTTLAGYNMPKGTMVMTNLTALHFDPAEWATPEKFNPEHFLEHGQFKKREDFLPFSIGKRACPGEVLARTELFIFFTALMQKFTFKPPDNEQLTQDFRIGFALAPVKYRICASPRA